MKKILFVCTGNTCRSPMAELCLKHKFRLAGIKGISVKSAGLMAVDGDKISKNSALALKSMGIKPYPFKSRQLTPEIIASSDLIICMTSGHKSRLAFTNKAYTLSELTGVEEVLDPFGMDLIAYKKTLSIIDSACNQIIKKIAQVLEG